MVMEKNSLGARVEAAEGKAGQAAEELAANIAELGKVKAELTGMKAAEEDINGNNYINLEFAVEFAYNLAYVDTLRVAKKGGLKIGPLVETFKTYTVEHPLDPFFTILILNLSTEYGIDMSWYVRPHRLVQPDSQRMIPMGRRSSMGEIRCPRPREEIRCLQLAKGQPPIKLELSRP
ncbi:hypothetical protein OROMI_011343 [Orobanche minor]